MTPPPRSASRSAAPSRPPKPTPRAMEVPTASRSSDEAAAAAAVPAPERKRRGFLGRRLPAVVDPKNMAKSAQAAAASVTHGAGGGAGGGVGGGAPGEDAAARVENSADNFAVMGFGDFVSLTLTEVGMVVGETQLSRLGVATTRGGVDGTFLGGLNPEDCAFCVCPKLSYRAQRELKALQYAAKKRLASSADRGGEVGCGDPRPKSPERRGTKQGGGGGGAGDVAPVSAPGLATLQTRASQEMARNRERMEKVRGEIGSYCPRTHARTHAPTDGEKEEKKAQSMINPRMNPHTPHAVSRGRLVA